MVKKLLFSSTATQKRVAVLEENAVVEYIVEQPDNCRMLGNIYRGIVDNIVPSIQSAFVDIGLEKNAFLNIADVEIDRISESCMSEGVINSNQVAIENLLQEGQEILVQISKESIGDKCPKVTTKISLAGRFLVLVPDSKNIGISKKSEGKKNRKRLQKLLKAMLPESMGCIVRTIGLDVNEELIYNELKLLVGEWEFVQQRALEGSEPRLLYKEQNITTQAIRDLFSKDVEEVIVDDENDYKEIVSYLAKIAPEMNSKITYYTHNVPLFDLHNIERDLDKSLRRKVWLKSGGYLFFDKTEALLAIDVNSGRNNSESNLEDTVFATNMEAAKEITRQLRLRDIGGIIVVDFIDMKKSENRTALEKKMSELLKNDPTVTACSELSRFGLMEMTRKRVRPGINEIMTEICPTCNGIGRVFSTKTTVSKIDRWLHRAQADNITSPVKIIVSESMFEYIERNNLSQQFENDYNIDLCFEVSKRLDKDEFEIYIADQSEHITEKHL